VFDVNSEAAGPVFTTICTVVLPEAMIN